MDVVLNINNLKYENLFQDISIYIEKSTITAISGPNNCGKSTLLKILSRSIKIHENIVLDGKELCEYTDYEYDKTVQAVFSEKKIFHENTIIEELYFQDKNIDKDKINFIISKLKLNKLKNKEISKLSEKEQMLAQIAIAILNSNNIVLIDEIDYYFTRDELIELYETFYQFIKKYNLTFIITCLNLESTININNLYIIKDGKVALKGHPLQVLAKDNILNKIGLEVPFMIDLSIKLKDYQLVDRIILKQDEMIGELWK